MASLMSWWLMSSTEKLLENGYLVDANGIIDVDGSRRLKFEWFHNNQ